MRGVSWERDGIAVRADRGQMDLMALTARALQDVEERERSSTVRKSGT